MKNEPEPYKKLAIANARGMSFMMGALVFGLISLLDALPRFSCIQSEADTILVGGAIFFTWLISWQILAELAIRAYLLLMEYQIRRIESDNKGAV